VPPACVALSPEPCPAAVGAFDRGKPIFSEKLTIHVHNAYLAVQHVAIYIVYTQSTHYAQRVRIASMAASS
jgi:hypothetical protein